MKEGEGKRSEIGGQEEKEEGMRKEEGTQKNKGDRRKREWDTGAKGVSDFQEEKGNFPRVSLVIVIIYHYYYYH